MANEADITADICETYLEESAGVSTALMAESRANAQSSHSIVRHSGARKFNQEDPIEAASVEKILKTS